MNWFKFSTNKITKQVKKVRGKPITLNLADKQEPFGSLDIQNIKAILSAEDFSQMQSLFFYMMRDLKISSLVNTRRMQLSGLDYTIKTDNQPFADFIATIDLSELITQLCSAIYYGVSLTDVSYQLVDNQLVPQFRLISPRYLHSHADKLLKTTAEHLYVKKDADKLFINKFDADKIVFHKHAIDIGEITDFSLASKLVWYFSLKHIALSHNLQFFDQIATPPLIVKTDGDISEVVDSLFDLKSAGVAGFAKEDIVEYLAGGANKADFLGFIEYIDRQLATAILGNSLSTGEGKNGSRSQSEVHEKRQIEILKADAKQLEKTLTEFLTRLEKLNFANPQGVAFKFNIKDKKDLKELSEVVKNISDAGFELDSEDLEQQFGLKIIGKKTPTVEQQNNSIIPDTNKQANSCACLGCGGVSHNNTRHDSRHNTQTNKAVDYLDQQNPSTKVLENNLVNSIATALKGADNYEDAYQQLLELYADMDVSELEEHFFNAIANSEVLAAAEIEQENKAETKAEK